MCADMHHVKFIFEVQSKDDDYFYCVPGSCVELVDNKTFTSKLYKLRVDFCREVSVAEETIYERCYSI